MDSMGSLEKKEWKPTSHRQLKKTNHGTISMGYIGVYWGYNPIY